MNVSFMPADKASILQPMDQGVMLHLSSDTVHSTFPKATVPSIVIPLMDLKVFWKGVTISECH